MTAALAMTDEHGELAVEAASLGSLKNEKSSWNKYVLPYCAEHNTSPWRPDINDIGGDDKLAEVIFMAAFVPWVLRRMKGRPGRSNRVTKMPLPSSAYDVLLNWVRKLGRHDIVTVPLSAARRSLKALVNRFVRINGPIQVQHKEAFPKKLLHELTQLPHGTQLHSITVDFESRYGLNLRALIRSWPERACRGQEVAPEEFSPAHLNRHSVSLWFPTGERIWNASRAQWLAADESCFVVIMPGVSKPDQDGSTWGNKPMWMPIRFGRAYNAGAAIRDMELGDPVIGKVKRMNTPLFCASKGTPFTTAFLARFIRQALVFLTGSVDEASRYSPHSFRALLATSLRACRMSHPDIMACCRWVTHESADVYAALDPLQYGAFIDAAYHVTPSLQHSREAPDVFGSEHEAIAVVCEDLVVDIEYNPDVAE